MYENITCGWSSEIETYVVAILAHHMIPLDVGYLFHFLLSTTPTV